MISIFIYPVVTHWVWTSTGWLTVYGFKDFAGSGVVHMVGGVSGLIGAIFLGPRNGRFPAIKVSSIENNIEEDEEKEEEYIPQNFTGHNMPMVVLGTLILWYGW